MLSNFGSFDALKGAANSGDFAAASQAAGTLLANAKRLADLWPAGSGGENTSARPAIWENMGDFKAKLAAFQGAAENALAKAGAKDGAGLAAAAGRVIGTCDACHLSYRY